MCPLYSVRKTAALLQQRDLIGDLGGRADKLLAAGDGDHQFADAQVLGLRAVPPCGGDGLRVAVADAALGDGRVVGRIDVGQRAVGVVGRQVALPDLLEHRDRGGPADLLQADVARLVGGFTWGVAQDERRRGKHLDTRSALGEANS